MKASAESLVRGLMNNPAALANLKSKNGIVIEYGAWFSGCNGISVALRSFSEVLFEMTGIKFHFKCVYCVEKNKSCQQFLGYMSASDRPVFIFADAKELGGYPIESIFLCLE